MIYYYEFLSFFFSLIHLSLALDFLKFLWVETISDAFLLFCLWLWKFSLNDQIKTKQKQMFWKQ